MSDSLLILSILGIWPAQGKDNLSRVVLLDMCTVQVRACLLKQHSLIWKDRRLAQLTCLSQQRKQLCLFWPWGDQRQWSRPIHYQWSWRWLQNIVPWRPASHSCISPRTAENHIQILLSISCSPECQQHTFAPMLTAKRILPFLCLKLSLSFKKKMWRVLVN